MAGVLNPTQAVRRSSRQSVKVTRYEDILMEQENEVIRMMTPSNGKKPEIMYWEGYNPLLNLEQNYKNRERSNRKKEAQMRAELVAKYERKKKERELRGRKRKVPGTSITGTSQPGPSEPGPSQSGPYVPEPSEPGPSEPGPSSFKRPYRKVTIVEAPVETVAVTSTTVDQFRCHKCPATFGSQSTYYYHLKQHGGEQKKLVCKYCDFSTAYAKNMKSHEELHDQHADFVPNSAAKRPKRVSVVVDKPIIQKVVRPSISKVDISKVNIKPPKKVTVQDVDMESGNDSDDQFIFSDEEDSDEEEEEPTGPVKLPENLFPPVKNEALRDAYIEVYTGFTRQFLEEKRWGVNPTMKALRELREKYPQPYRPNHNLSIFALNDKMSMLVKQNKVKKEPYVRGPLMTRARLVGSKIVRSCKKCSFKCCSQTEYVEHVDCHGYEAKFKCDKCDFMHENEEDLNKHRTNDHI